MVVEEDATAVCLRVLKESRHSQCSENHFASRKTRSFRIGFSFTPVGTSSIKSDPTREEKISQESPIRDVVKLIRNVHPGNCVITQIHTETAIRVNQRHGEVVKNISTPMERLALAPPEQTRLKPAQRRE